MRILLTAVVSLAAVYASSATADEYRRGFGDGWSAGYAAGKRGGGGGGGGTTAEPPFEISIVGGGSVSSEIEQLLNDQPSSVGIIQYESDGELVSVPMAVPLFGTFDPTDMESVARVRDLATGIVGEQGGMSISIFALENGRAIENAQDVTILDDGSIGTSPQWDQVLEGVNVLSVEPGSTISFE